MVLVVIVPVVSVIQRIHRSYLAEVGQIRFFVVAVVRYYFAHDVQVLLVAHYSTFFGAFDSVFLSE